MKKVHATASFGFVGADHEEDFEFDDAWTDDEIEKEIWQWAEEFVEVDFEIEEEEERED